MFVAKPAAENYGRWVGYKKNFEKGGVVRNLKNFNII
jgi:hypothetical protein